MQNTGAFGEGRAACLSENRAINMQILAKPAAPRRGSIGMGT